MHVDDVCNIVREALALQDASLVIFRAKTLIEFKTEGLGAGLQHQVEDGYDTWQIGDFDGHHCHLDMATVSQVEFVAEPTSCQGGRLNYTVWFLADEDCGNPYRPEGYFSVTFNAPYELDGAPRDALIDSMFQLYEQFVDVDGVSAEPCFQEQLHRARRA